MFIIYFLLGLGMTTAHSDYGVSFRAQNFDNTVRDIDKDAIINHRREKRFVTGYVALQNVTNNPTWGNLHIARNHTTFTGPGQPGYVEPLKNPTRNTFAKLGPYGNMTDVTGKYFDPGQKNNTNAIWPVNPNSITVRPGYNINSNNNNATGYIVPVNPATPGHTRYPGYPGYPAPNAVYPASNTGYPAPNTGYPVPTTGYPVPNTGYPASSTGYPTPNTWYPAPTTSYPATNINPGQNYNASVARPVYPNYNNINVIPANKNNFNNTNPSGYNIQPVNPVTPGNRPTNYPVPNTGYPASNTSNLAPNTRYPAPNTTYPAPNTWYPPPNSVYPAPSTGYPAPNTWHPPPNTVNPAANSVYPAPNTGYPAPNTGYPAPSGYFNNTASLENCKCKLPRANSTITKEVTSMDACMISCNTCPEGMKMSSFGMCVRDLDDDEE